MRRNPCQPSRICSSSSSQSPLPKVCGFDGATWTDEAALAEIARLADRWADAVRGLPTVDLQRRPIGDTWSVAEYADHTREVLFAMRFLVDTALGQPGTNLGDPPEPRFDPEPRALDVERSVRGLRHEVSQLCDRLRSTPLEAWAATVIVGGDRVDLHWIARHAVHDATHHLRDVARLRTHL